jgi:hypothetical protein
LSQGNNRKNITDGASFFTENELFKKKESQYLLRVFGLSVLLFLVVGRDGAVSYLLSLIASVLVINGYDKVKNESTHQ